MNCIGNVHGWVCGMPKNKANAWSLLGKFCLAIKSMLINSIHKSDVLPSQQSSQVLGQKYLLKV